MSFIDTSLLTVRNVTAYNSKERQTHILSNSAPAIDSIGYLKWKNSFQFISEMNEFTPTYAIQSGLSSVITPADENIKNGKPFNQRKSIFNKRIPASYYYG